MLFIGHVLNGNAQIKRMGKYMPCKHQSKEVWEGYISIGQSRLYSKEYCKDKNTIFHKEIRVK